MRFGAVRLGIAHAAHSLQANAAAAGKLWRCRTVSLAALSRREGAIKG